MDAIKQYLEIVKNFQTEAPCDDDDVLGRGSARTVCDHPKNPKYVIKHAYTDQERYGKEKGQIDNGLEYLIYQTMKRKNHPNLKYLAPVVKIADDASWIIMRKADHLDPQDSSNFSSIKKNVKWSKDVTYRNLGKLDGKTVIIDYGTQTGAQELGLPTELDEILEMIKEFKN